MGTAVGTVQWLSARKLFGATTAWIWASALGLGAPLAVWDLARVGTPEQALYFAPALGGLLVGLLQRRMLRSRSVSAVGWIPACIVGWSLAAACPLLVAGMGHPRTALELVRNLVAITLGGLVLGIVTGIELARLLRMRGRTP